MASSPIPTSIEFTLTCLRLKLLKVEPPVKSFFKVAF